MNVVLPSLYKWQYDVVNNFKTHRKGYWHVVKSRRQVGKSIMIENLLIMNALELAHTTNYMVSPSFNQADKIYNEMKEVLDKKPFVKKMNNLKRQIFFKNGSEIRCFSAEQGEYLRGYTVSGVLCVDESAYISDDIIDIIMPWTNANNAPVIFCSTPLAKAGRFYNMYMMGLDPNESSVFSYDWTEYDCSALLSPARLEFFRRTLDPLKFKTDYLGMFLDNESAFFGDYNDCLVSRKPAFIEGQECYFGIDWGSGVGGDYTAIAIVKKSGKKMILLDIVYFNDKDPNATINEIEKLADKWKPKKITVETNSIGNVYFGLLKDRMKFKGIPVNGFTTTNDSKDKIISRLQVLMQNSDIELFPEPELLVELGAYELEFSKTGKRIMNAKSGQHDDLIMALAIAINSISSGNYSLMFVR